MGTASKHILRTIRLLVLVAVMSFPVMWCANTFLGPQLLEFAFGGPLTYFRTAGLLGLAVLVVATIVGSLVFASSDGE